MNKTDILPFYSLLPTPYSLFPVPCSLFPGRSPIICLPFMVIWRNRSEGLDRFQNLITQGCLG
ncbi:MAG: hypothetical protein F6K49_15280 [Moorea sp. SIO3I6]|nr:hypothetical protein [Moorena sp. SIO3I6]